LLFSADVNIFFHTKNIIIEFHLLQAYTGTIERADNFHGSLTAATLQGAG
jgi:hypothetical protein